MSIARNSGLATSICAALLVFGLALPASAQSTAVLGVGGDGSDRLENELSEILLNAVENNRTLTALDQRDLDVSEALMFLGCSDISDSCLRELAFTLEVDRVIYAAVRSEEGETEVDVRYFDATDNSNLLDQTFPLNEPADRAEMELRLAAIVSNQVVLRVDAQRADVRVFLDGELLGNAPVVALDLAPGRHTLSAECDGCAEFERVLDMSRGVAYTETVRFDEPVAGADEPYIDEGGGGRNLLVPTILIGTGGAMLLTGAIFGIMMGNTQSDFDATDDLDEARELADQGDRQALLANVFLVTGAAVTITGMVLLFTMDGDEQQPPVTEVRAAPFFGRSSGGLFVEGTF